MNVYLTAEADAAYVRSAYAFRVGNFPIQSESHYEWTVVEAYLHGFLSLSNYIIRKGIYKPVTGFDICTASKPVIQLIKTDRLEYLYAHNWKDPDGPVFYIPVLKELYYHKKFYEERKILWTAVTEVNESMYREFESCQDEAKSLLV